MGLVKNLSLFCEITKGELSNPVLESITEQGVLGLEEVPASAIDAMYKVFLNGSWVGVHNDPGDLVRKLKGLRASAQLGSELAITLDTTLREVRFATDGGRCQRPLFVVQENRLLIRKRHVRCGARVLGMG